MNKIERARLRWDCKKQGCFNVKKRPKIELFADCFPGKAAMGDVDGIIEIDRHFMLLEWKSAPSLEIGQRILFKRLSEIGFWVLCVVGDAETMKVDCFCDFWKGERSPWMRADLEFIKKCIRSWVRYALQKP